MEPNQDLLGLREFIAGLRAELKAAHEDAVQGADDGGPTFTVGPVNIEFTVTAKKDAQAKGGVRFYVFELGAGGSVGSESTQKVSLVLTPKDYQVSDATPYDSQ